MDRIQQLESRVEDFRKSTSETYGRLRHQLLSALHELDKLHSETFQSLNALTHHFKSEVLLIQHELQAQQATREVLTVESNINLEEMSDSTAVKTSVLDTEQSYANTVGSKTASCGMSAPVQSRSWWLQELNASTATAASTASASCEASGVSHTSTGTSKRLKFQHHARRGGFISDSTFKFLVEKERMQMYLIQNNAVHAIHKNRETRLRKPEAMLDDSDIELIRTHTWNAWRHC